MDGSKSGRSRADSGGTVELEARIIHFEQMLAELHLRQLA
jgi:hypothetical protein